MDKISELEKRIKINPYDREFYTLASEYAKLGKLEDAKRVCLKALEKIPGHFQARLLLTQIFIAEGRFKEAREQVERVLLVVPDNVTANHLAADISLALGEREIALKYYKVVELFEPGRVGVKEKIVELESKKEIKQEEESVASFEEKEVEREDILEEKEKAKEKDLEAEEIKEEEKSPIFDEVSEEENELLKMVDLGSDEGNLLIDEGASFKEDEVQEEIAKQIVEEEEVIESQNEVKEGVENNNDELLKEEHIEEEEFKLEEKEEEKGSSFGISTATLAEIYERQGYPEKAIEILEHLLLKEPDREDIKLKIEKLKRQMMGLNIENDVGGVDVKSALRLKRIETLKMWLKKIREAENV